MKKFRIEWEDRISFSIVVEAESEEEALKKFHDGDEVNWSEREMGNEEYIQEPYVSGEV